MQPTMLPGYSESFAFCKDKKGRCHIAAARADRALHWALIDGNTMVNTTPVGTQGLHLAICLDQQERPCIAYLNPPHGIQVSRWEDDHWVHQRVAPLRSEDTAAWCSIAVFGASELVLTYCLTENTDSITDGTTSLRLHRLDATLQSTSAHLLTEKAGWMPSMVIDPEGQVHIFHNGIQQGIIVTNAAKGLEIPVYYTRFNLHTGNIENREIAHTQNKHQGDIRLIDGRVEVVFSDLRDGKGYVYTMDCATRTPELAYPLPGLAKCVRFLGPDRIMAIQPHFENKKSVSFYPEVAALQPILLYKNQGQAVVLPLKPLPFHKALHSKFFRLLEVIPDASNPLVLLSSDAQTVLLQLEEADFVMPPPAHQRSGQNSTFYPSNLQLAALSVLLVVAFALLKWASG